MRLKSGMGNQMFQYVMGIKLAILLETEVKFDLTALLDRSRGDAFIYRNYDLDIFNLTLQTTHSRKLLEFLATFKSNSITKFLRERVKKGRRYVVESAFKFQSELILDPIDNAVYEGWFQSYKYLIDIEPEVRQAFQFKYPVISQSYELLEEIISCNSICLNVRRTDFVENDNLNATDLDYFKRASEYLIDQVDNPIFYVFSDDIEWCRKNIKLSQPIKFVDHKHKGYKFGNYLQLMSHCKHFIIPNSSFAWWGAWLSASENKIVVAPKNWFNDPHISTDDLLPPQWLRI